MENQEPETPEEKVEKEEVSFSPQDIINLFKGIFDSKGFNAILDKFPTKVQKLEIESENKKNDFMYLKHRYVFDIITISVILLLYLFFILCKIN